MIVSTIKVRIRRLVKDKLIKNKLSPDFLTNGESLTKSQYDFINNLEIQSILMNLDNLVEYGILSKFKKEQYKRMRYGRVGKRNK